MAPTNIDELLMDLAAVEALDRGAGKLCERLLTLRGMLQAQALNLTGSSRFVEGASEGVLRELEATTLELRAWIARELGETSRSLGAWLDDAHATVEAS